MNKRQKKKRWVGLGYTDKRMPFEQIKYFKRLNRKYKYSRIEPINTLEDIEFYTGAIANDERTAQLLNQLIE